MNRGAFTEWERRMAPALWWRFLPRAALGDRGCGVMYVVLQRVSMLFHFCSGPRSDFGCGWEADCIADLSDLESLAVAHGAHWRAVPWMVAL